MNRPVIEVRNLSKRYRLGAIGATSLREETSRLWDRLRGIPHPDTQEFWALRDVSFDVRPGEVVGVIGRNGAGKSTLLKILSRITEPTSGLARLRGRVASLLEVGTGFHPELTGRENVFLNGAILGMKRAEIRSQFDEIVGFSGVEKFIDTPVKRYSSGMYVRLAFAVAAHLEPEILIVDEVLAVGDAEFQRKCIGKMQTVASHGRTVLFVSHNLSAISAMCGKALLLHRGAVVSFGAASCVIGEYLRSTQLEVKHDVTFAPNSAKPACLRGASICRIPGAGTDQFSVNDELAIRVEYELNDDARGMNLAMSLSRNGVLLLTSFDTDLSPERQTWRPRGRYQATLRLPRFLKAGRYSTDLGIGFTGIGLIDQRDEAVLFEIEELGVDFSQKSYSVTRNGEIICPIQWETSKIG